MIQVKQIVYLAALLWLIVLSESAEKYIAIPLSDIEIVPLDQQVVHDKHTTTKTIDRSSVRLPRGFSPNYYEMGAHTGAKGAYGWHADFPAQL